MKSLRFTACLLVLLGTAASVSSAEVAVALRQTGKKPTLSIPDPIVDDPDPVGSVLWIRYVHSTMGRLWVDWIDDVDEMGWMRQVVAGSWDPVQAEPFSGVEDRDYRARTTIRALALQ